MLNNLQGSIDAGGFGEEFHESIVSFAKVENLENILVSTASITRAAKHSGAKLAGARC